MGYLVPRDYTKQIQAEYLAQIVGVDSYVLANAELTALAEVISYLKQRYDTGREFSKLISNFSLTSTYKANALIILDGYDTYSTTIQYLAASKKIVIQAGKVYIIKTDTPSPAGAFDATKWTFIGSQYDLFYIKPPFAEFDLQRLYSVNDNTWWRDKNYKALTDTTILDDATLIQYKEYGNVPPPNVFPDDKINGKNQWGTGIDFSVSGLLPTNKKQDGTDYPAWDATPKSIGDRVIFTDGIIYEALTASTDVKPDTTIVKWKPIAWTSGDNRNALMVTYMVDMALYHLHSRINPNNIPELRMDRYDLALKWLDRARKGEVVADLISIQPAQGNRIRFGSNTKSTNSY